MANVAFPKPEFVLFYGVTFLLSHCGAIETIETIHSVYEGLPTVRELEINQIVCPPDKTIASGTACGGAPCIVKKRRSSESGFSQPRVSDGEVAPFNRRLKSNNAKTCFGCEAAVCWTLHELIN